MPKYDPESIPELGAKLPSGAFVGLFEEFDDSERTSSGKYQINVVLRTEEPEQFAGMPHYERFVIGSNADPDANDPLTWKSRENDQGRMVANVAAARYIEGLKKAGVTPTGDTEADFAAAKGQRVGFIVQQSVQAAENRDGTPNQYAGNVQSQIQQFFRVGERQPMVYGEAGPAKPAAPKPAAPAAPKPKAAPAPTAPPLKAPAPKPTPQPPAPPAAPRAPQPAAAPKKVPAAATTKCAICGNMIPRTDTKVAAWDENNPWMYEQQDDGSIVQLGLSRHVEVCASQVRDE